MTTEQKEAIEYLKEHINYFKEQIKFIEAVDSDYYDEEYEIYKNRVKQFETVLNLIQEKEKEIKSLDKAIHDEILENYDRQELYKKQLQKKDKIIELMTEQLAGLTIFDIDKEEPLILGDKEKVKQYFERKVENESN